GPYRYRGAMGGRPVSGFGFYERSIALYRDWELADVLAAAVADREPTDGQLASMVTRMGKLIGAGRRGSR
ncbi:MAG TPA: secreted hydrolase, partial [Mycobacterium sp.]|nr:secreted hydrolase [Mycobacterium sp.]